MDHETIAPPQERRQQVDPPTLAQLDAPAGCLLLRDLSPEDSQDASPVDIDALLSELLRILKPRGTA